MSGPSLLRRSSASVRTLLTIVLAVVLVLVVSMVSAISFFAGRQMLQPEIDRKAEAIAVSFAALVDHALEIGIPLSALVGVEQDFKAVLDANPDISGLALLAGDKDKPLFSQGDVGIDGVAARRPVGAAGHAEGAVLAVGNPAFARQLFYGIWLDLGIASLICVLVAMELLRLLFGARLTTGLDHIDRRLTAIRTGDLRPHPVTGLGAFAEAAKRAEAALDHIRSRHSRLTGTAEQRGDAQALFELRQIGARYALSEEPWSVAASAQAIRAPLFLFMLAHEMTRPVLPTYALSLASTQSLLSPTLTVSLSLTMFMAIVAILQLPLARRTAIWGRRNSFRAGAGLGAAGFMTSALAPGITGFVAGQALSAVGFALVFVSCQGYVIDTTTGETRIRGLATMVGAIMVAGLCGPALGGLLADRIGSAATFAASALLAVISLLVGWASIRVATPFVRDTNAPAAKTGAFKLICRSPTLVTLFLACALPAKLVLFAVCFYMVPLKMLSEGATPADIGRALMIYPVATVLLTPVFAELARRYGGKIVFVFVGALLTGLSFVYVVLPLGEWALYAMLLQFGVAQAISITPQAGLVGDFSAGHGPAIENEAFGFYRLVERIGSALGPAVAGALLATYSFNTIMLILAAVSVGGAVLFSVVASLRRRSGSLPSTYA